MSITAADILGFVNAKLNRSETSIDNQLVDAVQDLSTRGDFLKASSAISAVDGTEAYTEPDRIRSIDTIKVVDSDGEEQDPLDPLTLGELRRKAAYDATEGVPAHYARFNGQIYLYPTPDESYDLTVFYYAYHAATTTVAFEDRFRAALTVKVVAEVARGLEMYDQARYWLEVYAVEVAKLTEDSDQPDAAAVVNYSDI